MSAEEVPAESGLRTRRSALDVAVGTRRHGPPSPRAGLVARRRLVRRLCAARDQVVGIFAPAGFGKTTLLTAWAHEDPRPVAWLALEPADNDARALLAHVADELDDVIPDGAPLFDVLAQSLVSIHATALPLLAQGFQSAPSPVVLVLDDVHLIDNVDAVDCIASLAHHLPEGSVLALAGRGDNGLPLARLRAAGSLVEIGAADLAMNAEESKQLLQATAGPVDDTVVQNLTERTEGWPVGLYLAGLVLANQAVAAPLDATLGGDDRYLVDYIRAEVLSRLPSEEVRFLTRTAVLPVMSAEVCDAVLEQSGSQHLLESIERSNQLLVPMDRQRRWYRYHDLFRDALVADLQATDPETMRSVQQRAITWFAEHHMPERAFELAMSLGDLEQARGQLEQLIIPVFNEGRLSTLVTWINRFDEQVVERHLTLAIVSAWVGMMTGDPVRAERWARVAARLRDEDVSPSTSVPIPYYTFRAHLCAEGAEAMLADAQAALREVPEADHWRPPALFIHAMALLLDGQLDAADRAFDETSVIARSRVVPAVTMSLAERAVLALGRGDWNEARELSDRSRELVALHHLEEYPFSGITFAVAARVAIHRGDGATARAELRRAQRILPLLTRALPWLAIQVRVEMARAMVALIDIAGARVMLYEVDQTLRRIPAMGTLVDEAADLRSQLDNVTGQVSAGSSGLTTAELRLMPYLPTHLSFREIAERLFVSETTVKTQVVSVYRKLGVASRSEAVDRASQLGYFSLDPILRAHPRTARL